MSPRVLLASFLLMVTLSVVAAGLVLFPPPGPPVPEPLVPGLDTNQVTSLTLTRTSATEQIERHPALGWLCRWKSESASVVWPVQDVRVRGGLRMLADATLAENHRTEVGGDTVLELGGSIPTTITFGQGSAAGQAPVLVQTPGPPSGPRSSGTRNLRVGLTDDRLHAVFARSGMLPWRDERAMPGAARDPTSLVIEAPAAPGSPRLELARSQGRWGLREPAIDRAEAATVQASIDALARITIESFRDDATPGDLGLDAPRVQLRVDGGRGVDAYWWRLDIGGPASADGNRVFARMIGQRGDPSAAHGTMGPVYGVIGLDALSGVFTNPEAYLARSSLATPVADIRRFSIRTPDGARAWRYERTLDGWQVQSPTADTPRPATQVEAAAIPAVLELLATTPAASVSLEAPAGFTPAATLEVEGSAGLTQESVMIGRAPPDASAGAPAATGGAAVLVVSSGRTWRQYGPLPDALSSLLPVGP